MFDVLFEVLVSVVWKLVLMDVVVIKCMVLEVNVDDCVIGFVVWMYIFSLVKMWIVGFDVL